MEKEKNMRNKRRKEKQKEIEEKEEEIENRTYNEGPKERKLKRNKKNMDRNAHVERGEEPHDRSCQKTDKEPHDRWLMQAIPATYWSVNHPVSN